MANTQIDLDGNTVPPAPTIDASGAYDSFHGPNGINRVSAADSPAGTVDGTVCRTITIGTMRFANPA